jgi:hypothetical protein
MIAIRLPLGPAARKETDFREIWGAARLLGDPQQSFEFACHRLILCAQAFSAVRRCSNFSLFEFLPLVPLRGGGSPPVLTSSTVHLRSPLSIVPAGILSRLSATFTTMACMGFSLSSGFRAAVSLSCFLDRFLCSIWNPVSPPRPAVPQKPTRAGAVKVGRRTNLSTPSTLARLYLDSSEHGGALDAVGMTIRGEPAFGRADQSRHILVCGGSKGSEP